MTDPQPAHYPSGALMRFRNPEDVGLSMGGRVVSRLAPEADFEGGYLVVCHYVVPDYNVEREFKDSAIYPIKPIIARRLAAGHTHQDIALTYGMTVEDVQYLSPKE